MLSSGVEQSVEILETSVDDLLDRVLSLHKECEYLKSENRSLRIERENMRTELSALVQQIERRSGEV